MLKYVDAKVVFAEIPDEITLAIDISNVFVKHDCMNNYQVTPDIG